MKTILLGLALVVLLAPSGPASAKIGTIDDVPAATLLLPYFEVDLGKPDGITTLFSINNASPNAALAHVVVWTDQSIATLAFDVYLTGYDVQTINLRDVFGGVLPQTADARLDRGDTLSPNSGPAQNPPADVDFPGRMGPCSRPVDPFPSPTLTAATVEHLRNAHTGKPSPLLGGLCAGADYGEGYDLARGYVTVDVVRSCSLAIPSDPGYASLLAFDNVLWGDYFYANAAESYAQGETLVAVEACKPGETTGRCPFAPGAYTFYGRYSQADAKDQREPLATSFATRYVNGGAFNQGTDLIVWRDSKFLNTNTNAPHSCNVFTGWSNLSQVAIYSFDEWEHSSELCFNGDNVLPVAGDVTCFPLAAQRVDLDGGNIIAHDATPPYSFGWMYLDLNHKKPDSLFGTTAQAWVTTVMSAADRFSIGFDAIQLDNAGDGTPGGGVNPR
ncbi:MAG TPA: hypothetical protein VL025_16765 [Thermoanaerobaculia bacterium]|nr:hypothetical protein [Thermoanaerobaculia bacterium]